MTAPLRGFQTGVSLHSHTLHSRECLSFIARMTEHVPYLKSAIRKQEARYRNHFGKDVDWTRAWWTPPLSPAQALKLETEQIENTLGLRALVSLSDHDNMDAGNSVEWTVPFRNTFFHMGIHNASCTLAAEWLGWMKNFTHCPSENRLTDLLQWFGQSPETLVILNHPMWDEKGIGKALHWKLLGEFLHLNHGHIHALELNGLRSRDENRLTHALAKTVDLPVISGGDRHAREPNACVNLTNASTFSEFAAEVRNDQKSQVLFLPQYRQPLKLRIARSVCEVMREDPSHQMGWTRWSDRVFYLCDDGEERSLSQLWATKIPRVVNQFVAMVGLVSLGLRFSRTVSMR